MRKHLFFLAFISLSLNMNSYSQLVGTSAFLQGNFLEVGVASTGAFGACSPPATYHPFGVGTNLGEVYDDGHDGWTVGAPPYIGDYTYPGTPFEGWEMQVNGVRAQAMQGATGTGYSAPCPGVYWGTMTGAITGYNNIGGKATADWAGSFGGLNITQETRVDVNASWVVITTKIYNPTAAAIPGIYYLRSTDPDNEQTRSGSFTTTNTVIYQNDPRHRVLVNSVGTTYPQAYLGLGTRDCRAKCFWYSSWPIQPTVDLATVYASGTGIGTSGTAVGSTTTNDWGFGLVYDLGTLNAGDSTSLSYAYTFNGDTGIDSAFPDPVLLMNNNVAEMVLDSSINGHLDTFDACTLPVGVDTLPMHILYGDEKVWAFGKWKWMPATALSATTGVSVVVDLKAVPGNITYTVSGSDTNQAGYACNKAVFIFTVHSCHKALSNTPCLGDTLKLQMVGDSVGATYFWYRKPSGFTSTSRAPYIYPATFADTGYYYVIKTIGGISDTDSTNAVIYPWPTMNVTTNIPLCGSPLLTSLQLGITPGTPGEVFSWTGPHGFTSSSEFPLISSFTYADTGWYVVNAIDAHGCKNVGSVFVYPGVFPDFSYVRYPGCLSDSVEFTNLSVNASGYSWSFGDGSAFGTTFNATHTYEPPHNIKHVVLRLHNTRCDTSVAYDVDLTHTVHADFKPVPDTICTGQSIVFNDSSTSSYVVSRLLAGYLWNFADGGPSDATGTPPAHPYPDAGLYPVKLIVTDSIGCVDSVTKAVYVLGLHLQMRPDTTLCVSQPLALHSTITVFPNIALNYVYSWSPADHLDSPNVKMPYYTGLGLTTYTLTVSVDPYGCPVSDTMRIHSVLGVPLSNVTPNSSIPYGGSIHLNADSEVYYNWIPNNGSLNNPNINNPVATPLTTTTYTVYGFDVNGCLDSAFVTIFVDSSMDESIPSAFTPNGDGLNDVFRPVGVKYQRMVDFRIFNRFGQQVFYSNSYKNGWDGTWNGVPQDLGTYYYTITVARPGGDGDNVIYKGDITLIR